MTNGLDNEKIAPYKVYLRQKLPGLESKIGASNDVETFLRRSFDFGELTAVESKSSTIY